MAKMLWPIIVAACLCQCCEATAHAPAAAAVAPALGHALAAVANATNHTGNATHTKHHEEENTSLAGVILLGGICFVVTIFYMVNSHIEGVKQQTWSSLSTAVSIFVAVMANNTVNHLCRTPGEHHASVHKVLVDGGQLVATTFIFAVLLFLQRASPLRIYAYGVIGGHILGFGAIDTFATVAGLPDFEDSPWKTLLVFVIYIFAIHVLVLPLRFTFHLLEKCCANGNTSAKELDAAKEQAADTATDFFCMGGAFLLSMWVRGMIKGEVVEEEASGEKHALRDVALLSAAGTVFLILAAVMRLLQHRAKHNKFKTHTKTAAVLEVIGTMASLTCAWCYLDSGSWFWLHQFPEDLMLGRMAVAMEATFTFIVAVYIFSLAVKHVGVDFKQTLKGEFTAVGLFLGLAWEHVFDAALEGVAPYISNDATPLHLKRGALMALLTLALMICVFPAWVVYIVPKHDDKGVSLDGITPLAAFCDCEGGEEGESEEDEPLE